MILFVHPKQNAAFVLVPVNYQFVNVDLFDLNCWRNPLGYPIGHVGGGVAPILMVLALGF